MYVHVSLNSGNDVLDILSKNDASSDPGLIAQLMSVYNLMQRTLSDARGTPSTPGVFTCLLMFVLILTRYMVEATPGRPYSSSLSDLLLVEENMRLRCHNNSIALQSQCSDVVLSMQSCQSTHRHSASRRFHGERVLLFRCVIVAVWAARSSPPLCMPRIQRGSL